MKASSTPRNHNEYIAAHSRDVGSRLRQIRAIVKKTAPEAEEVISYRMPAFKLDGRILIYYAAHTSHTAIYPAPRSAPELKGELAGYGGGKGTVQFPHAEKFPAGLVGRIVRYKVKALREKHAKPKVMPASKQAGSITAARKAKRV
jgi:uncharacterized protein YdhG (YjbR/CyaY superfamily)